MEAEFLTQLDARCLDDNTWMLLSPLRYQSKFLNRIIEIPANYITDFASVPRLPVIYDLWGDRAHHEAVPHDWIYATHIYPKSIADKLFLEAMKARNKPLWIREPMYLAVKFGGASSYRKGPEKFKRLNPTLIGTY